MDVAVDLEIFGPVFPIIVADSREEMLRIANQTHYGLNAGVFTRSIHDAFWFATKLECGHVVVNGSPMYRPFIHGHGGPGLTGSGREGLRRSFEELTVEKGISFRNVLGS
jgi:acyl-CoA reductase-like NAD-dependent aldehyde dehydrogenase